MQEKGKLNAAEKHFEEKCVKWKKKIAELKMEKQIIYQDLTKVIKENKRLEDKNLLLEQMNNELMNLHGLSKKVEKLLAIYLP